MYADLCAELSQVSPKFETPEGGHPKDFRRVLIERCQRSFEFKERPKKIDPEITNPEIIVELMEQAKKLRDLNVGNVKFIGALFKKKMLTERVMHQCFAALLNESDEEGNSFKIFGFFFLNFL
jgi:translation initiation factor 4G